METIQTIINTVMTSIYFLMSACGIGLLLLKMVFTLNFRKIIHSIVSYVIVIAPYEEGKKLIRPKEPEDEFESALKEMKNKSTDLAKLKAFEKATGKFHKNF